MATWSSTNNHIPTYIYIPPTVLWVAHHYLISNCCISGLEYCICRHYLWLWACVAPPRYTFHSFRVWWTMHMLDGRKYWYVLPRKEVIRKVSSCTKVWISQLMYQGKISCMLCPMMWSHARNAQWDLGVKITCVMIYSIITSHLVRMIKRNPASTGCIGLCFLTGQSYLRRYLSRHST